MEWSISGVMVAEDWGEDTSSEAGVTAHGIV